MIFFSFLFFCQKIEKLKEEYGFDKNLTRGMIERVPLGRGRIYGEVKQHPQAHGYKRAVKKWHD